jgi:hypothetical protein
MRKSICGGASRSTNATTSLKLHKKGSGQFPPGAVFSYASGGLSPRHATCWSAPERTRWFGERFIFIRFHVEPTQE